MAIDDERAAAYNTDASANACSQLASMGGYNQPAVAVHAPHLGTDNVNGGMYVLYTVDDGMFGS
jgi:hypothetical protein